MDYKSLTCLEIKQILKKHKITGYSKLCKQELVKLLNKTLNNKKGGEGNNNNNYNKTLSLKNKVEHNIKTFKEYLDKTLNEHQKNRIIFLLGKCLDKRYFNKNDQRIEQCNELTKMINVDIRNELQSNPNCDEIINKIIYEYIDRILSSQANYRIFLKKNN